MGPRQGAWTLGERTAPFQRVKQSVSSQQPPGKRRTSSSSSSRCRGRTAGLRCTCLSLLFGSAKRKPQTSCCKLLIPAHTESVSFCVCLFSGSDSWNWVKHFYFLNLFFIVEIITDVSLLPLPPIVPPSTHSHPASGLQSYCLCP